jgi:thioredoxin reductase
MQKTVHIIGAGISGLSAAVRLANAGYKVAVHEATQQAGGRCRSYFDAATNLTIDNGNHLLLSGNRHALSYARSIGTEAGLVGDVDFDAVQAIAGAITPMPGGTGPMTIACLLENTVEAARMLGASVARGVHGASADRGRGAGKAKAKIDSARTCTAAIGNSVLVATAAQAPTGRSGSPHARRWLSQETPPSWWSLAWVCACVWRHGRRRCGR